jgi:Protein of unknown function (DUF1326)
MTSPSVPARPTYRVRAQSVEACNCALGCNCYFGGSPNEGICEFIIGYDIQEGRFGDVDLRGVRAVVAAKYPNAIHEGHGHVVLFVDQAASPEQVSALVTILSGQAGVLHPLGNDEDLAGTERDVSVMHANSDTALEDEEEVVRIVVLMPDKLALHLGHHHIVTVELPDDAGLPVLREGGKFLCQIGWSHHAP